VTAQLSAGIVLRRLGILVTPEEKSKPAVVRRANKLARQFAPLDETNDGLRTIHGDPELRISHTAFLPCEPLRKRGEISVEWALAEAKLLEAETLDEAIAWLAPNERMAVLLDSILLARLCALPARPPPSGGEKTDDASLR